MPTLDEEGNATLKEIVDLFKEMGCTPVRCGPPYTKIYLGNLPGDLTEDKVDVIIKQKKYKGEWKWSGLAPPKQIWLKKLDPNEVKSIDFGNASA